MLLACRRQDSLNGEQTNATSVHKLKLFLFQKTYVVLFFIFGHRYVTGNLVSKTRGKRWTRIVLFVILFLPIYHTNELKRSLLVKQTNKTT